MRDTKLIVTIGPSSESEHDLRTIEDCYFFQINNEIDSMDLNRCVIPASSDTDEIISAVIRTAR